MTPLRRAMLLHLATRGISASRGELTLTAPPGTDHEEATGEIARLRHDGLIRSHGRRWKLTDEGLEAARGVGRPELRDRATGGGPGRRRPSGKLEPPEDAPPTSSSPSPAALEGEEGLVIAEVNESPPMYDALSAHLRRIQGAVDEAAQRIDPTLAALIQAERSARDLLILRLDTHEVGDA